MVTKSNFRYFGGRKGCWQKCDVLKMQKHQVAHKQLQNKQTNKQKGLLLLVSNKQVVSVSTDLVHVFLQAVLILC